MVKEGPELTIKNNENNNGPFCELDVSSSSVELFEAYNERKNIMDNYTRQESILDFQTWAREISLQSIEDICDEFTLG